MFVQQCTILDGDKHRNKMEKSKRKRPRREIKSSSIEDMPKTQETVPASDSQESQGSGAVSKIQKQKDVANWNKGVQDPFAIIRQLNILVDNLDECEIDEQRAVANFVFACTKRIQQRLREKYPDCFTDEELIP